MTLAQIVAACEEFGQETGAKPATVVARDAAYDRSTVVACGVDVQVMSDPWVPCGYIAVLDGGRLAWTYDVNDKLRATRVFP